MYCARVKHATTIYLFAYYNIDNHLGKKICQLFINKMFHVDTATR